MKHWIHGAGLIAVAGCATTAPMLRAVPAPAPSPASASVRDAGGRPLAEARAWEVGDSIRVQLQATGMRPGTYGAHIHAVGRCDAPDFATAGPHWNPTGQQHGKNNPQGMHKGDLPNLFVGSDGRGSMEINVPGASVSTGTAALLDADGAAIVVHERADDYRTDPSGNSGARIGCGILR